MKTILLFALILMSATSLSGQCNASFTWDDTDITIQFMDNSTATPGDAIVSWLWDFDDDGNTSTQQNPSYTFSKDDKYDVVLTITTQNGCVSSVEIEIETCVLSVQHTIGSCQANGFIPVLLIVNDIWDNADEIDIILDGSSIPGSPFAIDQENPVMVIVNVQGDGQTHTIQVQSTDISSCGKTISIVAPDCSSDCFLSSLQVAYPAGITHTVNVGDDFFSPVSTAVVLGDIVNFNWIGGGHSTTSDATSGPDAWNSGVRSAGSTFDLVVDNPGAHPFYCTPHGGIGGVGMSGSILANCPTGNSLDLLLSFNSSSANAQGYNIYIDQALLAGSPFPYNGVGPQQRSINIPGDGMVHPLLIEDAFDPTCTLSMNYNAPDCDQGGGDPVCNLSLSIGAPSGCDANQNITATATISVANGGAGFNLTIDNGDPTYYSYNGPNNTINLTIPGDGQNHTITVTDDLNLTCIASTTITAPNCNLPCMISNLTTTAGGDGSGGTVHIVNVEDFIFNPSVVNITNGDQVEWKWTGAVAHTSTSDATSGVDSWDSGLLTTSNSFLSPVLKEGTHRYYCVPHGAPGGVGMSGTIFVLPPCNAEGEVMVNVAFDISSNGTSGFEVLVDGVLKGAFPYVGGAAQTASVNVPGDNSTHSIQVRDASDLSCVASTSIATTDCSGGGEPVCMLDLSAIVSGGCDVDNNVMVDLSITASDQGGNFNVNLDGSLIGSYAYTGSNTEVTINVPGDGQNHTITVSDDVDLTCIASTTITTSDCLSGCEINGINLIFGQNKRHTISVENFEFIPNSIDIILGDTVLFDWTGNIPHTATSDLNSGPNSFDSGLLTQGASYMIVLNSIGDHSYYCIPHGAPGGTGMAGNITVSPACQGDNAIASLSVDATGSSGQGFSLFLDGIELQESPLAFQPTGSSSGSIAVPGDNMSHVLEVADLANPSCKAMTTFIAPLCSATPCQTNISNISFSECSGATTTLTVDFTSEVGQENHNIYLDGNQLNTLPISTDELGNGRFTTDVSGLGVDVVIVVANVLLPSCTDTLLAMSPDCNVPCLMSDVTTVGAECDGTQWLTNYSFTVSAGSPLGYNIFVDGEQSNTTPISYDDPTGLNKGVVSLPGDEMVHLVTFQDMQTNFCAFTTSVTTGKCDAGCTINNLMAEVGAAVIHEVEVRDFDFFPKEIITNAGETVRFIWTGDIPHTSTSDAFGTVDSWDSQLLTKGDTFDIVMQTPGDHPYYCIPHGGPGGIGQSGLIHVLPQCQDGSQQVNIAFDASGGSLKGYKLFVDGDLIGGLNSYDDSEGSNTISPLILADGLQHIVTIQDDEDPICAESTFYQSENCATNCEIAGLDFKLVKNKHFVEVRDFDFFPLNLNVELGDTILFEWVGNIAHTVTSDATDGASTFNSGLLQNGDQWMQIIAEVGEHPYYCIPHGGPGGVGMAANITVVDACDDNKVTALGTFTASRLAGSYDVILNGGLMITGKAYNGTPQNNFVIQLPADNLELDIEVIDLSDSNCSTSLTIPGIDCNDPCFNVEAEFQYNINFATMEVEFNDLSSGNITAWAWDFGDGSTNNSSAPKHSFADPIVYEVCLTVEDDQGCESTFCDKVRFSNEVCIAGFSYEQHDLSFNFINSSDYEDPNTEILWTFGDGEISTEVDSIEHLFELGVYTVCIQIKSDSCTTDYCETIDLSDPCLTITPDFSLTKDETSLNVQFSDLSSGSPNSWLWGFGEGNTSTDQNPSHTFDAIGEYTICLFVQEEENSCSKTTCRKINVGSTGVAEIEQYKSMNIYPNPLRNGSNIYIDGFETIDDGAEALIQITNMKGQVIQTVTDILSTKFEINLKDHAGMFIISINTKNNYYHGMVLRH